MAFRQATEAFQKFTPCEGCEFWETLEDRSESLKKDVGRAVMELTKVIKEGQVWGNTINPVELARTTLTKHDLDDVGVDLVAMARCSLRQTVPPREVQVDVSNEYL